MNINYADSCNFKPIPAITPLDGYWQNGTWKFNMSEITAGAASQPSWIDIILKGNTALTLVNSKEDGLNYLKLFGGTEYIPETYIDSVTAEGKCEQRNLPSGYTQVDGVTNANSGYIDTGIVADVDDMEYDLVATIKDNGPVSWYILQSRAASALPIYGISGSTTSNTFIGCFSGTNIGIPSTEMTRTNGHTYHVNFVCKNGTGTITVEDLTDGTTATNTDTYTFASAPTNIGLFGNINGAGTMYGGNTSVHSAYIKKSGVKVMDYVSCTNSSSTAGFYDKATNSFKGATEGSMVAGNVTVPSPTTPMDIVCNNGVIGWDSVNQQITVTGTTETITDAQGNVATCENLLSVGTYKDTQEILSGAVTRNVAIKVLDGTETWNKINNQNAYYVKIEDMLYCNPTQAGLSNQFVGSSLATADMPDNSVKLTYTNNLENGAVLFKHNDTTTLEDWVQFVTDQYNGGTPIIALYPLATATTESVSGQVLNKTPLTYAGSVSGLTGTVTDSTHTTTTPTQPLQINCNNGAVKLRHISGLPEGFTLLEYIEADGSQQINTGVKLASTDVVYSEFANSSSSGYGALYGVYQTGESSAFYANQTYYGYDESNNKVNTNVSVDTEWHTVTHDFVNGTLTIDDTTVNFTPFTFANTADNYLFCRYYNGSYGYGFKGKCKRHMITRGNTVLCDLVPVYSIADDESGMYDLENNVFLPNVGSGTFNIGDAVQDYEIYVDGTTETVEVHSKNLYNPATQTNNKFLNDSGAEVNNNNYSYTDYIAVKSGEQYTCQFVKTTGAPAGTLRIHGYNSSKVWVEMLFSSLSALETTITIPSGISYVRISWWNDTYSTDKQFELGSTTTTYEPYFNGGTATAQYLFGNGVVKDVQEVKTGAITRNFGVYIFNGSESWSSTSTSSGNNYRIYTYSDLTQAATPTTYTVPWGCCSHFTWYSNENNTGPTYQGAPQYSCWLTTAGNFRIKLPYDGDITSTSLLKAWMKEQFLIGKPLYIVFPLATATTESVTGQPLTIQAGTNIVEITQASMDNLELEVKYKAGVEVTITEVQNAQLDNSVEVTIQ